MQLKEGRYNYREMEKFLMERLKLVNNIVTRLQHSTEQAYSRRDAFVHTMLQATANAQQVCQSTYNRQLTNQYLICFHNMF